ncbi:TPA: helix-turn-helix transcriptional regulator [Clostridioides difficile]|uniref:helix-turn-helix transcriptional regulator n=1 Tax=Clostridioides difficile TaxID=1496 RepID=UPI001C1C5EEA|nr:helix-turn-helix domain-containing protein [Clostridioides difficile]MBY2832810.1 helix-turn-helix domain-containing protein [Clostridioides difficile]MDW0092562.1 helix-turn-helix transcriptional regulator [Clostridioides difficile]HBF4443197.1 helix-turn-helix transcriptional regulator [Clostridioides difficile]HBG1420731.1 helix-turn-helix transcriptional regulator [Clostridioides difficile]
MSQWLYQDYNYTIGSALKRLRKKTGLSQEQVSSKLQTMGCDVSRAAYAQMETGTYGIRISVLVALKHIFNAKYADFFSDLP